MNPAVEVLPETTAAVSAVPARFVDNGDGTITDASAGLMWSKATLCTSKVTHKQAGKLCTGLDLAGHNDWRLPTRAELLSLVDDTRSDPSIDTARFPDTKSSAYWTSTPLASVSSCAWIVYFDVGYAYSFHRSYYNAFVRAVRSVPAGQ